MMRPDHPPGPAWGSVVDVDTAAAALTEGDVVVIDCRHSLFDADAGRRAWETGHLPGARHADLQRDLSGPAAPGAGRHPLPDARVLAETLRAWGVSPRQRVLAYDGNDGSMAAARLWWLLRMLGHERVAVLDGGLAQWIGKGLPLEEAPPGAAPAGTFQGRYRDGWLADTEELLLRLDQSPGWLVDARSPERFAGHNEPIDPVAGHVPGAVNRPYTENLGPDGRFKPAAQLAREFSGLIGDHPVQSVVVMCGSGVTACHHVLAMHHAGMPGARVHAPSWSGWVSDPQRPVATAS